MMDNPDALRPFTKSLFLPAMFCTAFWRFYMLNSGLSSLNQFGINTCKQCLH